MPRAGPTGRAAPAPVLSGPIPQDKPADLSRGQVTVAFTRGRCYNGEGNQKSMRLARLVSLVGGTRVRTVIAAPKSGGGGSGTGT